MSIQNPQKCQARGKIKGEREVKMQSPLVMRKLRKLRTEWDQQRAWRAKKGPNDQMHEIYNEGRDREDQEKAYWGRAPVPLGLTG